MGALLWLAAGVTVAGVTRLVPASRRGWRVELTAALATSFILGLAATALDFGGWREPDVRAGLFCLFGAATAVAMVRLRAGRPRAT
jgi:hypothetical protein